MSGCGSSRPVPPARRKASFQQTTWPSRLVRATRRATQGRAGQGRAGQGRGRAEQGRAGQGRGRAGREAPRPCNSPAWAPKTPLGVPPRGTLGRGPRSEPRAPMQMVSGALGSFRVEGLGFRVSGLRVWGLGFQG